MEKVPIRVINFSELTDKARHEEIIALVERMLALHKQLAVVKNPNEKTHLARETEATDRQINQLVYELYGLTEDDIRIVNEAMP
jgi:predicted  nucleic acid-binding Zn-ribbon protein